MSVQPEDDLIQGAPLAGLGGGPGFGSQGTMRSNPYPEFEQKFTGADRRMIRRSAQQMRRYVQSGATPNPAYINDALMRAGAWQKRQQAKAAEIVANRDTYVEMATRLDGLGKSYPYLGADVAFALAMSGHGPDSQAATAAASAAAATDPRYGTSTIPEADTNALTARAALEFARTNSDLGDGDLVAELRSRGFNFEGVRGFTWDGTAFRTITDPTVTASIHEVLGAEADLQDDSEEDKGIFGEMFGGVKWFTRGAFATVTAPWEALNASIRENYQNEAEREGGYGALGIDDKLQAVVGAFWGAGWDEGWDETTFAEASRQLWREGEMNAGTGWFMGGSVEATKRARDYAWYANQIGEDPATMGRLVASTVLKPGSQPYKLASGVVDGVGALVFDPSTYLPAGAIAKVARVTPGVSGMTRATHWVDWSDNAARTEISVTPTPLDEAGMRLSPDAVERTPGFPRSMEMPRAADQAGVVDVWAPRWYAGGGPSDASLLRILRGGGTQVEEAGLKIRSRRKVDGMEPVTFEIDPAGLRGYADTTPDTDWAREIDRGFSTQVVPVGETADDFAARLTRIHVREPLDSGHPLNAELNKLVTDKGWHKVTRTYTNTDGTTRKTVSLYRPDQALPPGTRVSPFVDSVDEATGEINRVLSGGEGLVTPLGNWTPSVTADLSPGTFGTLFPEIRPLRTEELFDRNPIAGVTNPDLLDEIPPAESFRVMFQTDQLRGGVDVDGGTEQINQSVWREDPTSAWPAPKPPEPITFEEARATAAADLEKHLRNERPRMLAQAIEQVEDLEAAAGEGAPFGFIRGLSKMDQERALTTGEVPLEDLLNAYSPDDVESLARYMQHGPVPEDRVAGIRAESELGVNDQVVYDAIRTNLPKAQAEKVIADWKAGKTVRIRTKGEKKGLAVPKVHTRGRVVDADGNVVNPGRKVVQKYQTVGGGQKITYEVPGINTLEDVRANILREYDPDSVAGHLVEQRRAEIAAAEQVPAGKPLYAVERADLETPVGRAESGYHEARLFDTARTAASNADDLAMAGHRAVALRFKGGKPPKIADLDDPEVAELLRLHLDNRMNKMVDSLAARGDNTPQELWDEVDKFETMMRGGDITGAVRALRDVAARMPESQGNAQARAAAEMESVLDLVRADGYHAVRWVDRGGKQARPEGWTSPSGKWDYNPMTNEQLAYARQDAATAEYGRWMNAVDKAKTPEAKAKAQAGLEKAGDDLDEASRAYDNLTPAERAKIPDSEYRKTINDRGEVEVAEAIPAGKGATGGKEFFELLDPKKWRTGPVKKVKESERTRRVSDAWDEGRFGVRFSARQGVLRDQAAVIDAPKARPKGMEEGRWNAWRDQRERLLAKGWQVEDTTHGREVWRRPLNGEYDGKAGEELHRAMGEGNVSLETDELNGINRVGTRETIVPEQFYKFVTKPEHKPLWEKVAASTSFEDITRMIGNQPTSVIARLIKADDPDKVLEAVIEGAGLKEIRRLSIQGAGVEKLRAAADTMLQHTPGFRRSLDDIRLLHVMPGQYVNLADPDQAAYELHNWMMTAKVPKADRDRVMAEMLSMGTTYGRKEIYMATFGSKGVVAESMRAHLAKAWKRNKDDADVDSTVQQALALFRKDHERNAAYHIKDPGERGTVPGNALASNDEVVPSPQILGDFFDGVLPLPNPREIKRITGLIGRMAASGYDVKRAKILDGVIRAADGYNSFFKVTALARVAYPVRVLLEEQGRLYGTGYVNIYNHPMQMIMHTVKGNKGTDLMGRKWTDLAADPDPNAYADAMVNARLMMDNDDSVKFLANHYIPVGPEDERYLDGWMFGLGKLHADPVARRLVGKWTLDEIAAMPQQLVDEGDNVKLVAHWLTTHQNGREYLTSLREASAKTLPDFSLTLRREEGVQTWIRELDDQIRYMTAQGDEALTEVIRTGRLKAGDDTVSLFSNPVAGKGGQTYNAGQFKKALGNYSRLDAKPTRVIAPDAMVARESAGLYDRAVTQMFSYLNGRPTNYLSRSPVFREEYYKRVAAYMNAVDDDAVGPLLKTIRESGATRQQVKAIEKAAAKRRPGEGTLTRADVDALAKDDALQEVKALLYDTSNKTHLWDAMRIAAPFGAAWAEVVKTWTKIAMDNPKVLDRLAHAIHGAQQPGANVMYEATGTPHDSDQGFFFKDLRTGDESFAWPMPPQFQQFLSAGTPSGNAGVMMPAPVAGLNLIGQVQPGFGPIVTAPAGILLNQPGWKEDVLNFIAPFGGPSPDESGGVANAIVDSVTPAWMRKMLTAVYPVNAEQKSQLASATLSAQVHLASTGKYDLGDPADAERLLADAQGMARRLFFLRAVGQFFLPTIGSPEQSAITGNGEIVLQTKLASILRQYQSDPGEGGFGYQEGYVRFLRDFGSEVYLMGVDRTDSTGFMAPTRGTYDWMRQHPELIGRYEKVWGLLVDEPGTEFYYPAYQAQVRQGFRTMLNPEDLVALANARLGRALYTSYRAQYGETPNEVEAGTLRGLQDQLELQFPGYTRIPETGFTTPGKILQLERAANDPDVKALPVGASLTTYFAQRKSYRDQGVSSFRTGLGREVAPELYALGQQLAASDPTFEVAWERLLSYEFDSAQFEGVS